VLLEELETLYAELLQEEEAETKKEAGKPRPGLTTFTHGSRLDDGAVPGRCQDGCTEKAGILRMETG